MTGDMKSENGIWLKLGIVGAVLAILAATLALLVHMVVMSAYFDVGPDNWISFYLPPVLWLIVCCACGWLITRLSRRLGKPEAAGPLKIAGALAIVLVGVFLAVLVTS